MRSPLERVQLGVFLLATIVVLSVTGYWLAGYPVIEAIWMVVVTIASVGYGEHSTQSPLIQLLTIAVILFGYTAAAFTFGSLLQFLLAGELEKLLGRQRMTSEIAKLEGHTIVVGMGRIGGILAADLHRHRWPFVVIEKEADLCLQATERGYLNIHGDASDDDILLEAGATRARSLISALPDDADNVFITLTARNINRELLIVSRAEHPSSERKLRQAGASRIVMPSTIGAQQISRIITRPNTADFMEFFAEQGNLDVEMDELHFPANSRLVGMTIRQTEAHHRFGLLVLAVKRTGLGMSVNPPADFRLEAGDIVIVLGRPDEIAGFIAEYKL